MEIHLWSEILDFVAFVLFVLSVTKILNTQFWLFAGLFIDCPTKINKVVYQEKLTFRQSQFTKQSKSTQGSSARVEELLSILSSGPIFAHYWKWREYLHQFFIAQENDHSQMGDKTLMVDCTINMICIFNKGAFINYVDKILRILDPLPSTFVVKFTT